MPEFKLTPVTPKKEKRKKKMLDSVSLLQTQLAPNKSIFFSFNQVDFILG
jgi:hypothetical protein